MVEHRHITHCAINLRSRPTGAGCALLAKALAAVNKKGGRVYEAELYRLKGELTLAQSRVQSPVSRVRKSSGPGVGGPASEIPDSQLLNLSSYVEAEECFLKAIEIARKQQANSWELRAAMSLSRLWQQQGKKDEARRTLAEIYNWFTEGFDTKDLQEAKALLEELL
jgi:hypothetical protein